MHCLRNINTIREGIGEKLGSVIRGVSSFFAAITLSFIADWRLALIPLITGPMAIALALLMTKVCKFFNFLFSKNAILVNQ